MLRTAQEIRNIPDGLLALHEGRFRVCTETSIESWGQSSFSIVQTGSGVCACSIVERLEGCGKREEDASYQKVSLEYQLRSKI